MEPPPYIYFFSPFTWVLPESTRLQPPQPAAGPHLSMNIKIMYIALTTSAPVFYCFDNTQGTDRDHFLTHMAADLAMLCKSPVLDRKKKKKKKAVHAGNGRQDRQRTRWEDNIREWTGLEFAKSRRTGEQGKMEETGCEIIHGAPSILVVMG